MQESHQRNQLQSSAGSTIPASKSREEKATTRSCQPKLPMQLHLTRNQYYNKMPVMKEKPQQYLSKDYKLQDYKWRATVILGRQI